ncbi:MAG: GTPase ObgE [Holosporales bacterium]|jgi:GTP-binding protein|nr:GTPase ObgE [Holosporales bacterium]
MRFLDEAKVYIKAGDGGDGCLSFRHEKFIEFGGPDGGNGGRGGSVYATAVRDINTLVDYRYKQHFQAARGKNGEGQNRTGRSGEDIVLRLPVGTQILDDDKETEIADLTEEGQTVLLVEGGKGGAGNASFKSSINQAPRKTTKGQVGEEKWIWLKLKLIADIGLLGMPNAGKSSFIMAVTNAKARIADYPFSTVKPQLGVIKVYDNEYVIADIPGLVEDAHSGKGLGDKFLAHIERCSVFVHIIDISAPDPLENYIKIRNEISLYNKLLGEKPEIVVLNKKDLITAEQTDRILQDFKEKCPSKVFATSTINNAEECTNIVTKLIGSEFLNNRKKTEW